MCKKESNPPADNYRIHPLGPVIEGDADSEYNVYKGFLDVALSKPDVRNVAVTGNFGIGKSRFLHYYAEGKNYLFVSGCSFFEHEEANENSVEYNLLYQLLLGCRQSGEWQRRIQKVCFLLTPLFLLGTVFFLTLAPTLGTYLRELTIPGLNWPLYKATLSYWLHVLVYGLTFVLLAADAVFLMRSNSLKLKSISLKLGGVEMAAEKAKEESPLYKNRDMLIQALVESANKIDRTVIFEDMDRLGESCCIDLFTKLWELNKLVNLCMKKEKPIRFIYVIHDALFALASAKKSSTTGQDTPSLKGENETEDASHSAEKHNEQEQKQPSPDAYVQLKFFDYILPILPSMSEKDAIVAIKNLLDGGQNELTNLITPLAPYLSDYRLLRNIVNEYSVFSKILSKHNTANPVDKKKLFAFAIYKNLMPQDYKRLREKNSIVFPNSQEKAQDKSLPKSIRLLIENHWLDDTCLHYVGYDKKGLKDCIESAFKKGIDTASMKEYWLENEPDLCWEVMASCADTPANFIVDGVEFSFAALALTKEGDLNITCNTGTQGCQPCTDKLLNRIHLGLGLGITEASLPNGNNLSRQQEILCFLLKRGSQIWKFVPNSDGGLQTDEGKWWTLIRSLNDKDAVAGLDTCFLEQSSNQPPKNHLCMWVKTSELFKTPKWKGPPTSPLIKEKFSNMSKRSNMSVLATQDYSDKT